LLYAAYPLIHFVNSFRAVITFGLNALQGRKQIRKGVWGGAWNSSNAQEFMEYTVSMNYPIDSWEFGNTFVECKTIFFADETRSMFHSRKAYM
jgi:V8-like Glu-specific endopeptidase